MVEAAGLGVQRFEAGGDAGKAAAGVERLLGHLHGERRGLGEALDRALAAAFLRDPVERGLGFSICALGSTSSLVSSARSTISRPTPTRARSKARS
jgi:hypothetical protein